MWFLFKILNLEPWNPFPNAPPSWEGWEKKLSFFYAAVIATAVVVRTTALVGVDFVIENSDTLMFE